MSDLKLDVDQASELKAAFRRGDWTNEEIKRLSEGDTLAQFRKALLGHAVITEREPPAPKPEPVLDTIIRVDRAVRPIYPDWMKKVMHPELEANGLAEYDLANVQLWLHDGQRGGNLVKGQRIYDHLKKTDTLKTCLGLRDGEEIKKKGIEVFGKFFGGKSVFLWASVVLGRFGRLDVPCLIEFGGEVELRWDWLVYDWDGRSPALRSAS